MSNNKKKKALGDDPFANLGGLDLWDEEPLGAAGKTAVFEQPVALTLTPPPAQQVDDPDAPSLASLVLAAPPTVEEETAVMVQSVPPPSVVLEEEAAVVAEASVPTPAVKEAIRKFLAAMDEKTAVEAPEPTPPPAVVEDIPLVEPSQLFEDEMWSSLLQEAEAAEETAVVAKGLEAEPALVDEMPVGQEIQYIVFELAGVQYAVPIANVLEIMQPQRITAVPNVPEWLMGVTNWRGDILSLVDFRRFLDLPCAEFAHERQLLVVQDSKAELMTGLVVDKVLDRQRLQENDIGTAEVPIPAPVKPYASGVYDLDSAFLVVLNVNSLLNSTEMQQFETAV